MSKHRFLRRHPGEGTPVILAIVLVLLMLFCTVAEFCRVWIIAQSVKEAAQQAVISTINDNYDDVYHAVREGYAAGWYCWVPLEHLKNGLKVYPLELIPYIVNEPKEVIHFVSKEN